MKSKEYSLRKRIKNGIPFYFMLAPFYILFLVFTIIPVVSSVFLSFTDFNMMQIPKFTLIDNYIKLFLEDEIFVIALKNTLVFAVITGPIGYLLSFTDADNSVLFALAYDDIDSLIYFNEPVKAYWKKDGKTIIEAIDEALFEYDELYKECCAFSFDMNKRAVKAGGAKYAELLNLAYRQVLGAHKLAVDNDGNNIYISKECFSNGCAATVDITYPSSPLFLLYNTELVKSMLRPIMRYAKSDAWKFNFAPHDIGQYPFLNGHVYNSEDAAGLMPVEECGNILILMAAISKADGNAEFAKEYIKELKIWNEYLVKFGLDPDDQLCTDDFAGHIAHNCNLSIKAIMGMTGFSYILNKLGYTEDADALFKKTKEYAESFEKNAKNSDGSYRLTYDKPDTFSLKYNAVWDKAWNTDLFSKDFFKGELVRYKKEAYTYGVPLDSRKKYTKSDWLMWVACFADDVEGFEFFSNRLWSAYNTMSDRVAMTDWYHADTSQMAGTFRNRPVQGGLFMKLFIYSLI